MQAEGGPAGGGHHEVTVREFDMMLERHLPDLAAELARKRHDDGQRDEDGLLLADRWDTFSVSGTALISVFPNFLDRMAEAPDHDAVGHFIAFLREWESRDPGAVLERAMPLWLRWHVQQSAVLMRLFPPDLSDGYAE